MKNLPIKKGIKESLEEAKGPTRFSYPGVWKIRGRKLYLKLASKIESPPVKIPSTGYEGALKKVLACAKVYKRLVKEGLYPPSTGIAVCKDDKGYLTLLVIMPELDTAKVGSRLYDLKKKLNLEYKLDSDLTIGFNWGCDEKGNEYAHDLHICNNFSDILRLAEELGIK